MKKTQSNSFFFPCVMYVLAPDHFQPLKQSMINIYVFFYCRKTIKWWKKTFIRVFELLVINAMILYHLNYPEKEAYQSHKKFRLELFHQLEQPSLDEKAERTVYRTGRSPAVNAARLQGKIFQKADTWKKVLCSVCLQEEKEWKNCLHKNI